MEIGAIAQSPPECSKQCATRQATIKKGCRIYYKLLKLPVKNRPNRNCQTDWINQQRDRLLRRCHLADSAKHQLNIGREQDHDGEYDNNSKQDYQHGNLKGA